MIDLKRHILGFVAAAIFLFAVSNAAFSQTTTTPEVKPAEPEQVVPQPEESEELLPAPEEETIPEISYDLEALPFPTRRMHELILEAAHAGNIEKLRQLIGIGDSATQLTFGGVSDDPIKFLKQESGDDDGHEILAILSEVLEAGYVHLDKGTENELFVWPYFFALPLDGLNDKQKVELFRIVTYGDFQDMQEFGSYIFYRVGISPSGRWEFFVAGD